jgi:endonuclease/exonuclease/phosphatase family metal-dependent hydrolase/2'-5' RNA ligase
MASPSEFRLVSTATAIAIVVPKDAQANINALRSVHDKAFRKWEPHINILYPFVEPARLAPAIETLRGAVSSGDFRDLRVDVDAVDVFRHRRNATVFLRPSVDAEERLTRLRGVLTATLGCDESEGTHDGEFRPHMTVGQASLVGPTLERLVAKVEKLKGVGWHVKSLAVLRRKSSGEMELVDEIALSDAAEGEEAESGHVQRELMDNWAPSYAISDSESVKPLAPGLHSTQNTRKSVDISITSYNLMVEPRAPPLSVRAPRLLENIASSSSNSSAELDVLCLQEVNEEILGWLLGDSTLQQRYPYCSHNRSSVMPSHRNLVIMASRPFTSFTLQFEERHKSSLLAYFADFNVTVANVHLSSALTDSSVGIKKQQMSMLIKFLEADHKIRDSQVVVAGDFNLTTSTRTIETALSRRIIVPDTSDLVRDVVDPAVWDDAYLMHRDGADELDDGGYEGEEGATFDRLHNPLAAMFEPPIDNRPQRYDRVLVRAASNVSVYSFVRFGLPNELGECASDHYGVSAHMRLGGRDGGQSGLERDINTLQLHYETIQLVADSTDLEPLISSYLPSTSDKIQREDALTLLQSTLSGNEKLGDVLLAPLGSYAMKTYFKDSDVDVLAIGSISPREFFNLAIIELRALHSQGDDDGFKAVHYVNSLVPILELVIQGIKIDLQYCQAVELLNVYVSFLLTGSVEY